MDGWMDGSRDRHSVKRRLIPNHLISVLLHDYFIQKNELQLETLSFLTEL